MPNRRTTSRSALVLLALVVGLLGQGMRAQAQAPETGGAVRDAYARGHATLMTSPYSALVRVGLTNQTPGDRPSTLSVAFDAAASAGGYTATNIRSSGLEALVASRIIGTDGHVFWEVTDEPRAIIADADATSRARIYYGRGSSLVTPAPSMLGDYVEVPTANPSRTSLRATISTEDAQRIVAEAIGGSTRVDAVASRLVMRSAVLRATVDRPSGRIVRTHVHLRAWIPVDAFRGLRVPEEMKALEGTRLTVASEFTPVTLPREPDVAVPLTSMPYDDWLDTREARASIVEAAVLVTIYLNMKGSLKGISPRWARSIDTDLSLVYGRGTTKAGTVGLVVHRDRQSFTLRVTARNGWTYRLVSTSEALIGTCRMAGKSCGVWLRF